MPVDSAIKIAQVPGDPAMVPLYAYETGAVMFNGLVAPARRVMLPMGDTTFERMTENGIKLFDAAVAWAANLSTGNEPRFNAPTRQGNTITLSWTGTGTLEQADSVSGPWTPAPSQGNPQSVATSAPARFFRIRR